MRVVSDRGSERGGGGGSDGGGAAGRGTRSGIGGQSRPAIIARTRAASTSTENGLVIICIPGSR